MNYLGIDYGQKKIGLATAESSVKIATPFKVIENKGNDFIFEQVNNLIQKDFIDEVIVGLPVSLSGSESDQTKEVLKFIELLKNNISIPVRQMDERMTTHYAGTLLRGSKNKKMEDAIAASIILQSYLDK